MFFKFFKKSVLLLSLVLLTMYLLTTPWFLQKFYPYPHQRLISTNCLKYKVDPLFVLAIMKAESRFYTGAYSRAGAMGLMQIMPETGEWIARQMGLFDFETTKLFEPQYNIPMGIWYLAYLAENFEGKKVKIAVAYNAGTNRTKRWLAEGVWSGELEDLKNIPFGETQKYVQRVFFNYQVYQHIYPTN